MGRDGWGGVAPPRPSPTIGSLGQLHKRSPAWLPRRKTDMEPSGPEIWPPVAALTDFVRSEKGYRTII